MVVEVVPGLGEMTLALAAKVRKVIAVEIDPKLVAILREKVEACPKVEVIEEDILKVDFRRLLGQEGSRIKVVANLPYQISTPLLFRFIDSKEVFSTLTLMLQREVAERIGASPDGKDYSPLSIFVQSVSEPSIRFFVKSSSFFPPPKVESAVVHITWRTEPLVPSTLEDWFKRLVRGCFMYRRKTLFNGLKHSGFALSQDMERKMGEIGIDPCRRPETLTI